MRKLRMISIAVMLVSILLGQSQSALAGNATHFTVRLENATIPWVPFPPPVGLNGSFCDEIPLDVNINPDDFGSDRLKHATQTVRPDGSVVIVTSDLIKGTASDNSGISYTFVYQNDVTYHFDGSVVTAQMKDTFKMKGGDVNYIVGFNWRWKYPADSLQVVEFKDVNGKTVDIGVDPFFFATNDGVNEDPNIVPGSWQRLTTRGDPWNCDPL